MKLKLVVYIKFYFDSLISPSLRAFSLLPSPSNCFFVCLFPLHSRSAPLNFSFEQLYVSVSQMRNCSSISNRWNWQDRLRKQVFLLLLSMEGINPRLRKLWTLCKMLKHKKKVNFNYYYT
ncbi:uncharacterized protein LOC104882900 [Beta vulgaris subsp. vulgaris]|nr:uncharacterized protein LOC104882900 [Beta vulgaris subsp. vulgaris]